MSKPLFVSETSLGLPRASSWSPTKKSALRRTLSASDHTPILQRKSLDDSIVSPRKQTVSIDAEDLRRKAMTDSGPNSPRSALLKRKLKQMFMPTHTRIILNRDFLRQDRPKIFMIPDDKISPEMREHLEKAQICFENENSLYLICKCQPDCQEHAPIAMAMTFDVIFTVAPELISKADRFCQELFRERYSAAHLPEEGEWKRYEVSGRSFADYKITETYKVAMFF
jgi:hypothetical protein